jgi:hypothetical protein
VTLLDDKKEMGASKNDDFQYIQTDQNEKIPDYTG